MTRTALVAVLAAAVGLGTGLVLMSGLVGDPGISDTPVYERYGERIASGDVPYRDFAVEYPPGALIPFVLPALVSSTSDRFETAFEALMTVFLATICVLIVIALQAFRAPPAQIAFSRRRLRSRCEPARPVHPDSLRPLRGDVHSRCDLRHPAPTPDARADPARSRDRDEDLPRRPRPSRRNPRLEAGRPRRRRSVPSP